MSPLPHCGLWCVRVPSLRFSPMMPMANLRRTREMSEI